MIELNSLGELSKSNDLEIPVEQIELDIENARLVAPVRLNCEVSRTGSQTDVTGKIATQIEVDCIRCLEPLSVPLKFDFDVRYIDALDFAVGSEHEISGEDLNADSLEGDKLDLVQVAREQLLLNLPEQILCREDCRGICGNCGANRNLTDCKCDDEEIDPRWAALKNLK